MVEMSSSKRKTKMVMEGDILMGISVESRALLLVSGHGSCGNLLEIQNLSHMIEGFLERESKWRFGYLKSCSSRTWFKEKSGTGGRG